MNHLRLRKPTKAVGVFALLGIVILSTTSSPAQVLITSQPQSNVLFPGGVASFTVAAESGSPLSFQWRFNGSNVAGATTGSLVISNLQWADAGSYDVIITDTLVTTNSDAAILSIVPVAAWGSNSSGQTNVPANATNIVMVKAGDFPDRGALTTEGKFVYWANTAFISNGVPADASDIVDFALGFTFTIALRTNGQMALWGGSSYAPTNVPPDLTNLVAVAAGRLHAMALKSDGTVVAWGGNPWGQTNVPPWLTNVIAIDSLEMHSLALTVDGKVVSWGNNISGQTNVPAALSNVVAISAGSGISAALLQDGTAHVWGNTTGNPQVIPSAATNLVMIDAGQPMVGLRGDGRVIVWGYNPNGRYTVPTGLTNVSAISAGGSSIVALIGEQQNLRRFSVSQPILTPEGFAVTVPTQSGRVYRLEYKNSLSDSNWTALPLAAGTGVMRVLTDASATGSQQRFYRVRQW